MPSLALIFRLVAGGRSSRGRRRLCFDGTSKESLPRECSTRCGMVRLPRDARQEDIRAWRESMHLRALRELLEKIKESSLVDGFKARDNYQQGWSFLDTKELTQAALEELMEAGWLREIRAHAAGQARRPAFVAKLRDSPQEPRDPQGEAPCRMRTLEFLKGLPSQPPKPTKPYFCPLWRVL